MVSSQQTTTEHQRHEAVVTTVVTTLMIGTDVELAEDVEVTRKTERAVDVDKSVVNVTEAKAKQATSLMRNEVVTDVATGVKKATKTPTPKKTTRMSEKPKHPLLLKKPSQSKKKNHKCPWRITSHREHLVSRNSA